MHRTMLKFLFLLFVGLLVIPRLLGALIPRRTKSTRTKSRPDSRPGGKQDPDDLRDLTRQDITDADYEDIPPEE